MVHDHPIPAVLYECEAIPCWQRLRFSILHVRERVVARVHGSVTINTDQLFTEVDLEVRQNLERADKIVTQACAIRSQRWGKRSPQDAISGIEIDNLVGLVLA